MSWLNEGYRQLEFLIVGGVMLDPGRVVGVTRSDEGSMIRLTDSRYVLYVNCNYDKLLIELYMCRSGRGSC